jgi:uncharacterized membrane protein YkoI
MTPTSRHSRHSRRLAVLLSFTVILGAAWCSLDAAAAAGAKDSPEVQSANLAGRISKEQATQAALQALPGKVTDVTIEKKRGKTVYVIEIVAEKDGAETDVLVDMTSGAVLGMDH